ncbi:hypothetical protein GH714_008488 [Hevea brasiliensis]|uniref:Uncharacterized protein n=1 Tax=Hevea brasiliensis TaxID=3981 RepID=A0A6A6LWL7_HEVBR|nr:hypothetical protein GH714_008488 [Hevea brasiliensis]
MGKKSYLAMRTDQETSDSIVSDIKDLSEAAKKLANHAIKLGGLGFGTSFLEWLASFAAILAGNARCSDSSDSSGSQFVCKHVKE